MANEVTAADTQTEAETPLEGLAQLLLDQVELTVSMLLADQKNPQNEKCAALLEACALGAVRMAKNLGCPPHEAVWALRALLSEIESEYVEQVKGQMEARVGPAKPGEEATALSDAEQSLIEVPTSYSKR